MTDTRYPQCDTAPKSETVATVARGLGMTGVDIPMSQPDPTDLRGIPIPVKDEHTWKINLPINPIHRIDGDVERSSPPWCATKPTPVIPDNHQFVNSEEYLGEEWYKNGVYISSPVSRSED